MAFAACATAGRPVYAADWPDVLDLVRRGWLAAACDTFVLCDLQGVSPAEAAEVMGTPVATTYSRLRVARVEFTAAVKRILRRLSRLAGP